MGEPFRRLLADGVVIDASPWRGGPWFALQVRFAPGGAFQSLLLGGDLVAGLCELLSVREFQPGDYDLLWCPPDDARFFVDWGLFRFADRQHWSVRRRDGSFSAFPGGFVFIGGGL
jgi:hypothetical protein